MIGDIPEDTYLAIFRSNPLIETLDLRDSLSSDNSVWTMLDTLTPTLIDKLTFRQGSTTTAKDGILPNLTKLYLSLPAVETPRAFAPWSGRNPRHDEILAIVGMIESRRQDWIPKDMARLEKIALGPLWTMPEVLPGSSLKRVRELVAEGLDMVTPLYNDWRG